MATFTIDDNLSARLSRAAADARRSPDDLAAEALNAYLDLQAWRDAETIKALGEADKGDFADDAEVDRTRAKWRA